MISLFDRDDLNMLNCKTGDFERENPQRWNANNSAVWRHEEEIPEVDFIKQWLAMVEAGRGEPGIFSRDAAMRLMPERRTRYGEFGEPIQFGSNPCGEIILRPFGMCNLTTVNGSKLDYAQLQEAVAVATIVGTIQSLATKFPYLRPQWKQNCEEERLLGVSIGGQMDNDRLHGESRDAVLSELKQTAIETNRQWAEKFNINVSSAISCVKPDGNSSQLLEMSSGIGPRHAPYYIRNVRVSASSPVAKVMRDAGVPMSAENGEEDPKNPRTWVASFPVKAPEGALTRKDVTAISQCEQWLANKLYWTEHNPSVTITYKPDEVIDLMKWVWDHRDKIGGMAFLPSFDAKYDQLPYIEIDEAEYKRRVAEFPEIDFSKIFRYEASDMTTAAQEIACVTGVCDINDMIRPS